MTDRIETDPFATALLENKLLSVIVAVGEEVEFANETFLKLSGLSKRDLRERDLSKLILSSSGLSSSEVLSAADESIVSCILMHKDGIELPVEISATSFMVHGVLKRAIIVNDASKAGTYQDIKRSFISRVSSDLRSPLSSLNGSLALIRSERMAKLPDSLKNVVTIATRNCNRLTLMINDILERERLESGKIILQRRDLDLEEITSRAIKLTAGYADDAGVSVSKPLGKFIVFADEERLVQVVAVLLRHSILRAERGSNMILDMAKSEGNSKRAALKIGYQKKSASVSETHDLLDIDSDFTSLSLDVCREVVRLHDGVLRFEDSQGNGSLCVIELPIPQD